MKRFRAKGMWETKKSNLERGRKGVNKEQCLTYIDELEGLLESVYDRLDGLDEESTKAQILSEIDSIQGEIAETIEIEDEPEEPQEIEDES